MSASPPRASTSEKRSRSSDDDDDATDAAQSPSRFPPVVCMACASPFQDRIELVDGKRVDMHPYVITPCGHAACGMCVAQMREFSGVCTYCGVTAVFPHEFDSHLNHLVRVLKELDNTAVEQHVEGVSKRPRSESTARFDAIWFAMTGLSSEFVALRQQQHRTSIATCDTQLAAIDASAARLVEQKAAVLLTVDDVGKRLTHLLQSHMAEVRRDVTRVTANKKKRLDAMHDGVSVTKAQCTLAGALATAASDLEPFVRGRVPNELGEALCYKPLVRPMEDIERELAELEALAVHHSADAVVTDLLASSVVIQQVTGCRYRGHPLPHSSLHWQHRTVIGMCLLLRCRE